MIGKDDIIRSQEKKIQELRTEIERLQNEFVRLQQVNKNLKRLLEEDSFTGMSEIITEEDS